MSGESQSPSSKDECEYKVEDVKIESGRGGYYVLAKLNALNFSEIKVLNLLPH